MSFLLCLFHAYSCYQLSDVANGLCYLHSCNVIHGNLKGVGSSISNFTTILIPGQPTILVDNSGHVCLAGFVTAIVTQNPNSVQITSLQDIYTPRWAAPEALSGDGYSKKVDIFSFAMVVIEVCCR